MRKPVFLIALLLSACGGLEVKPSSSAGKVTLVYSENELPGGCLAGRKLQAYGSLEEETVTDLRHQAYERHGAQWVVAEKIEAFIQTGRLENYQRLPQLKAPKGTTKYYYEDAFTMTMKGRAFHCRP